MLRETPGILHIRIEAPLADRFRRVQAQEDVSLGTAEQIVTQREKAAADYLNRFSDIEWSDAILYHLVINTGRWDLEAAAHL